MATLRQQFEQSCMREGIWLSSDYSHTRDCYSSMEEQAMYEDFVDHKITEAVLAVKQDYSYPNTELHSTEEYVQNAVEQLIRKGYRL